MKQLCLYVIGLVCAYSSLVSTAGAGSWDVRMAGSARADIWGLLPESGGGLIVHGGWSSFLPGSQSPILRWDGRNYESLGSLRQEVVGGGVYAMVEYDGGLVAGGAFTGGDNLVATNIAFLKDGVWSAPGGGLNGAVRALVLAGGAVVAGGDFMFSGEVAVSHVARWTGEDWANLGEGLPGVVHALAANEESIFAAWTPEVGGKNIVSLWNGANWSEIGSFVTSRAVDSATEIASSLLWVEGKLYVGGRFTEVDGADLKGIASWDGNWSSAAQTLLDAEAWSLDEEGGKIYAAGKFAVTNGMDTNTSALVVLEGGQWQVLGPDEAASGRVVAAMGNEVYLVGQHVDGTRHEESDQILWQYNGTEWFRLNNGLWGVDQFYRLMPFDGDLLVTAIAQNRGIFRWDERKLEPMPTRSNQPGEVLLAEHDVALIEGVPWMHARISDGGRTETNVLAKLEEGMWQQATDPMPLAPSAIAGFDGEVWMGGRYPNNTGQMHKWDGVTWTQVPGEFRAPGSYSINGGVGFLFNYQDHLFVAGTFTNTGTSEAKYLAEWDAEQSVWKPVPGTPDGWITAVLVKDEVYLVSESRPSGQPLTQRIMRWDGMEWNEVVTVHASSTIQALAISDEGMLAIGGRFFTVEGKPGRGIAILREEGWSFPAAGYPGEFIVNDLVWRGRDLYMAGEFLRSGPVQALHLAIWHESGAKLESWRTQEGELEIRVTGEIPADYQMESSPDLETWTAAGENGLGQRAFVLPVPAEGSVFHRLSERE